MCCWYHPQVSLDAYFNMLSCFSSLCIHLKLISVQQVLHTVLSVLPAVVAPKDSLFSSLGKPACNLIDCCA